MNHEHIIFQWMLGFYANLQMPINPLHPSKCTHGAADKLFYMYFILDDHLSQAQVKSKCSKLRDERP